MLPCVNPAFHTVDYPMVRVQLLLIDLRSWLMVVAHLIVALSAAYCSGRPSLGRQEPFPEPRTEAEGMLRCSDY